MLDLKTCSKLGELVKSSLLLGEENEQRVSWWGDTGRKYQASVHRIVCTTSYHPSCQAESTFPGSVSWGLMEERRHAFQQVRLLHFSYSDLKPMIMVTLEAYLAKLREPKVAKGLEDGRLLDSKRPWEAT